MATPVIMPRQGQSVESCIITKWNKKVGDKVAVGDLLFTYETDKATFDETAQTEGTLLAILHGEGDDVPCLENVCIIGAAGEDVSALAGSAPKQEAPAAAAPVQAAVSAPAAAPAVTADNLKNIGATPVIMPRQGQSVESCIITKWNKKVGDKVAVGDLLFTYETDKATFDEESQIEGTLLAILHGEGDDVPCLENVCIIGKEGTDVSALAGTAQAAKAAPAPAAAPAAVPVQSAPAAAPVQASADGKVKISPRAKAYAEKTGVDYRYATPTGAEGRIIERDIEALRASGVMATMAAKDEYLSGAKQVEGTGIGGRVTTADLSGKPAVQAPAAASAQTVAAAPASSAAEYEDVKLTNIRKVISKSMMASLTGMAQLTLNTSFDATEIMAYRKKIKDNGEKLGLANITLNDMVMYAVARTLLAHKALNANLINGETMRYFKDAHIGMAVDTERGLMVPTIFNANKLSLNELALECKKLAADCQKGSISPDKLSGGTFTVSNLGAMGIESFTPVINPPQTGILGVDTIVTRVKEAGGTITTYPAMGLSLTFDHRAVDGAPAAKYLKDLVANLENFSALLSK